MGVTRKNACPPTRANSGIRNEDFPGCSVQLSRTDSMAHALASVARPRRRKIYVHALMVANDRTLCAHHPGAHLLVCGAYQQVRGRTPTQPLGRAPALVEVPAPRVQDMQVAPNGLPSHRCTEVSRRPTLGWVDVGEDIACVDRDASSGRRGRPQPYTR